LHFAFAIKHRGSDCDIVELRLALNRDVPPTAGDNMFDASQGVPVRFIPAMRIG
jgi:hypothetical protein